MKTKTILPPELWAIIFQYVGDWEISRALQVLCEDTPTPPEWDQNSNEPKTSCEYLCGLWNGQC